MNNTLMRIARMRKDKEEEERRKRARREPRAVSWESLTKEWDLGATRQHEQFEGFIMMNYKVHSVRFDFGKNSDLSLNPVELLDQVEVTKILPCDGLLLLVVEDESRLVVWNPYLGQTRSIPPRTNFHNLDMYAIGYDISRNHKIWRYVDVHGRDSHIFASEIYDFSSSAWRVLEGGCPDFLLRSNQRGVSVKGNTYFYSHDHRDVWRDPPITQVEKKEEEEVFIVCFDFTTERFGPHLPLPFDSKFHFDQTGNTVSLSCLPEDPLAVFYFQSWEYEAKTPTVEIWISTKIEPNSVSWTNFFKVDVSFGLHFIQKGGSFFIDEQAKVAVIFDINSYIFAGDPVYNTAFFLGEARCFKKVRLGEAIRSRQVGEGIYCAPLLSASPYFPSSVQVEQLDQA